MTFEERALAAVQKYGVSIIPVEPRGKAPIYGAKSRVNTLDGVKEFTKKVPTDANYGIVADENFSLLETDDVTKFTAALGGGKIPHTLCISASPNRGYWVFRQTDKTRAIRKNLEWDGVFEWRHVNEYCVGPGSIHPSGREYRVVIDAPPAPFPDWLVDKLQELYRQAPVSSKPGVTTEVDKDAYSTLRAAYLENLNPFDLLKPDVEISMGRHGTLLSIAGLIHNGERDEEEAIEVLEQLWEKVCTRPPRGRKEIEDIVHHAFSKDPCELGQGIVYSDGNTLRLFPNQAAYDAEVAQLLLARHKAGGDVPPPLKDWRSLFHTYAELRDAPPVKFAIDGFLQEECITILGGLAGHGKTLVALAMARALLEGSPLFNHFNVARRSEKLLYLIPEAGKSSFAHRLRTFRLMKHIEAERMFVYTLSMPVAITLTDPLFLEACKDADVFLDTAVRFMEGEENSASDQRGFADTLFTAIRAGARTVTGLHHSPKSAERMDYMSLENTLRGSGDIGAMISTGWGLKQIDPKKNRIFVNNIKAREFDACDSFIIEGRPHLDLDGYFKMTDTPGAAGTLNEAKPRRDGERPSGRPGNPEKENIFPRILELHAEGKSLREISAAVGVSHKTVGTWIEKYEMQNLAGERPEPK